MKVVKAPELGKVVVAAFACLGVFANTLPRMLIYKRRVGRRGRSMADLVSWIELDCIGQLTGSSSWRDPLWPSPDDPIHIPVVNDTGRWGVHRR